MRFDSAAQAIVDRIKAAGMSAAVDPRDLDPPAVWVQLAGLDLTRFGAGWWASSWTLTAVAGDAGTSDALKSLGQLSDTLVATFDTLRGGTAVGVVLPAGPDPLPGMQYTVDLRCRDDDPAPPPPPPPPPPERQAP
jgi:hypothetical protein